MFYKVKEINASSSLGQTFFTFNARVRACVRVCVCMCVCVRACVSFSFFYILFFHNSMYFISSFFNFQIHLISYAPSLAGSVSIGAVVGFWRKINHHWLMSFLCRDLL